jgi:hypothetical protein
VSSSPLVLPLVVDGNAERGLWRTFPQVLNPGSHDDDVPSTADLKVVFGNLNKIAVTIESIGLADFWSEESSKVADN